MAQFFLKKTRYLHLLFEVKLFPQSGTINALVIITEIA